MKKIPDSKKTTLDNGMRIVTEKIDTLRSVSIGINVGVGSINETEDIAGLSHVLEHMNFKGTKKRTAFQIAKELDSVGGRINAYTSKESTFFYAVVQDKHVDIAVDVLSDILLNSIYDPKELETEKGVVLEEIKMYNDTPDELIHDMFIETLFHGHQLGRPTIGSEKSVRSLKRENIVEYLGSHYRPDNMIVSVAGNIDHDNACAMLSPLFEKLKAGGRPDAIPHPSVKKGVKLLNKKTEQIHICIGTKGIAQTDEDRHAFTIIDNILGGTMSSRLFQELREKRGLAYSVYSYISSFKQTGAFTVYIGTSKKNYRTAIELIVEELNKLKKEGLTDKELERGKEYLKGSLVLGLESSQARMSWLAQSEYFYNRVLTIDEVFDKIDRVSGKDIMRVANEYIRDEYLTLTVIGDLKEKELPRI